ncbi:hypothetical protein EIN_268410 [Entamoeba invadens IP1]|uniref:Serine aminopeptidase S33 domain-containing protein n=1 Tax=Entamoeba invadens IP1 TaxID=370355 RepID=A0A0A1UE64_ENTIV|nr:hypothetical protein EIN_268410 [Entamoeba invadens IP1]ELP91095.1 hypothetical protein EIN_268410 [Entamoeba invadens IP1]|eukprot:XP_004257866.1 hypothetical protein EIN_268410 [Entamoeba invadens IP1]
MNERIEVNNIPSLVWGPHADKVILAIHGYSSNKSDVPITLLFEEATTRGFQVLSYDLAKFGERKEESIVNYITDDLRELNLIYKYAQNRWKHISIFGNSYGAYLALIFFSKECIEKCLFLSPVVDFNYVIEGMMKIYQVTVDQLFKEKEIVCSPSMKLLWDNYKFTTDNPIVQWNIKTFILHGSLDTVNPTNVVSSFSSRFHCILNESSCSPHYFYAQKDIDILRTWIDSSLDA